MKSIRSKLSVATCVLLSSAVSNETQARGDSTWEGSASALLYVEEGRVTVNEDVIALRKEIDDDEFISGKFIFDVMSGPSPNGASESSKPQTMTTPSGQQVIIASDVLPTYDFLDTRYAMLLDWEKPLSRILRATSSMSLSVEYDYLSVGLSSVWSYDLNNKLTTLTSGLALTYDQVSPVGGVPEELEVMGTDSVLSKDNKKTLDWMFGASQIINRTSIFQINYTLGLTKGYLTDPYKLITVVDDQSLEAETTNPYFHEKRPNKRLSHIVYLKYIKDFSGQVLRSSYRYFRDDWQIQSHTLDVKYSFPLRESDELQFHVRFYDQSAASFYHYYFVDRTSDPSINPNDVIDENVSNIENLNDFVTYASADYRLGNLQTFTVGAKYSTRLNFYEGKIDLRLDHLRQKDKENQFPELRAWVLQAVFSFVY